MTIAPTQPPIPSQQSILTLVANENPLLKAGCWQRDDTRRPSGPAWLNTPRLYEEIAKVLLKKLRPLC